MISQGDGKVRWSYLIHDLEAAAASLDMSLTTGDDFLRFNNAVDTLGKRRAKFLEDQK